MKAELKEIDDRRRALKYFLKGKLAKDLPKEKRDLMEEQLKLYEASKDVLIKRLELE